jgi:cytoskeleton-associated protein 5
VVPLLLLLPKSKTGTHISPILNCIPSCTLFLHGFVGALIRFLFSKPKAPSNSVTARAAASKPTSQASTASKTTAPAKKAGGKAGASSSASGGGDNENIPFIPLEDALAKASELLPASVLSGVASSAWKERLAAIEELTGFVDKISPEELDDAADVIVRQLQHKPGWKESNVQVRTLIYMIWSHFLWCLCVVI